jgi:hypothetical protein
MSAAPASPPDSEAPWPRRRRRTGSERTAQAESDRIDADIARREAELEVARAESARHRADALRVAAESTAHKAMQERDEALARAAELEAALADAQAPGAPGAVVPVETSAPEAAPEQPAAVEPAPEVVAAGGPDVAFAPRGSRPLLTVLLSAGALAAAGTAVYLAYLDRLSSTAGIVTGVATLALVVAINRVGQSATSVAIRRGVVHVEGRDGSVQFDVTNLDNLVEMVGQPGESGWKVVFLRKTKPSVTVDASMVDPHAFTEALRGWRPGL